MKKIVNTYYPFLPLILLCLYYAFKAMAFPIHDFSNYYFSGKFLATRSFDSQIYFPYEFNKAIADLGYNNVFASYAPNTPFLALVFVPFSFLTALTAKFLFNFISIGLFVFSLYRLFSFYNLNFKWALLIPILFLIPIKNSLLFGQVYFLLFFLIAEGWMAYEKERWKIMAVCWAFAVLLKVFPILLLFLLIFKKQRKPAIFLTLSIALLLAVSFLFTGIDIWTFYLKEVLSKASNGEIATAFVDNYQSVFMFLKRIFVYDGVENPHPFFPVANLFTALVLAFKIGLVALAYFVARNIKNNLQVFGFFMLIMILISPYGSTYTFVLTLFPLLALLQCEISNIKKIVAVSILLVINNVPISLFIENEFPFSYLRFGFLVAFLCIYIIWFFQKSVVIKSFVIGSTAFCIGFFVRPKNPAISEALQLPGNPVLVYDYQIKKNQLIYFYWDENGENQQSIPIEYSSIHTLKNQINMVSEKGHKSKSILIDGNTLIYLSDYGRGIGFYTLRRIKMR